MLKEYNLVRKLSILLFICTIPQHNIYPPLINKKSRKFFLDFQLGYKDSNLEMTESESVALPFGDSAMFLFVSCSLTLL